MDHIKGVVGETGDLGANLLVVVVTQEEVMVAEDIIGPEAAE